MGSKTRTLAVLSIAQALAMLPWYNYSAILPLVQTEWGLGSVEAGIILAAFQAGYVAWVLGAGWLSDRVGGRTVFTLSALETGLASIGFGLFAADFTSGLVWRVLVGLGQGGLYVPGMRLLSRWYPPRERGLSFGIYTSASVVAYASSYLLAGPLGAAYGWRTGVLFTSVWALLAAPLVFYLVAEAPQQNTAPAALPAAATVASSGGAMRRGFLANLPAWAIIGGYSGHMWELYTFWGWVGPFVATALIGHGAERADAVAMGGTLAAAMVVVGGIATATAGGLADRLGRCLTATLMLVVSAACGLVFGWLLGSPLWAILIVGLVYGFFVVADSAIYKAGLTELVPEQVAGSALGVQSSLGFSMTIVSPIVFGLVLDMAGWGWSFSILSIGGFVGILFMLWLRAMPRSQLMAGGRR